MECLFSPYIFDSNKMINIRGDELKHIKALRLNRTENVLVTNGRGDTCLCELSNIEKDIAEFRVIEHYENFNENDYSLSLAVSLLASRDRLEFAVEKAVELGVKRIIPLHSRFTQKSKFKRSRIEAKIIAALKQCKRSVLPILDDLTELTQLCRAGTDFDDIILFDEEGEKPQHNLLSNNILILIGPEGGFAPSEIECFRKFHNTKIWSLGNRRLRAETAAVNALSIVNYLKLMKE